MAKISKLERASRSLASSLNEAASDERVIEVNIGDIEPDPNQPRKQIDAASIKALAASIKAQGLLQPIIIRKNETGEGAVYRIRYGERRWRASQEAGLSTIKAIVSASQQSDEELLAAQLTENLHREDMNIADTIAGVTRLINEVGAKRGAEMLAKPQSWFSKIKKIGAAGGAVARAVSDTGVTDIETLYNLARLQEQDSLVADRLVTKWASGSADRPRADTIAMLDRLAGKTTEDEKPTGKEKATAPAAPEAPPAARNTVEPASGATASRSGSRDPDDGDDDGDDDEKPTRKASKTTREAGSTDKPPVVATGSVADIQREGGGGDYTPSRALSDVYRVLSMNVEGDMVTLKTDRGELHFDKSLLDVVGLS